LVNYIIGSRIERKHRILRKIEMATGHESRLQPIQLGLPRLIAEKENGDAPVEISRRDIAFDDLPQVVPDCNLSRGGTQFFARKNDEKQYAGEDNIQRNSDFLGTGPFIATRSAMKIGQHSDSRKHRK